MTVWTDNATAFATRDRQAVADQLLTNAIREVIAAYRLAHRLEPAGMPDARTGLVDDATTTLTGAGDRAERILGRTAA